MGVCQGFQPVQCLGGGTHCTEWHFQTFLNQYSKILKDYNDVGYKDLTMSIYFHSRFSFDYDEESTLKAFNVLIDNFVV